MIKRNFLSCKLCNQQVCLRIQVTDILAQFPAFINCVKCESEISFIVKEDKILKIKNAIELSLPMEKEPIGMYFISGDFFVPQRKEFKNITDMDNDIINNKEIASLFIFQSSKMGFENYQKFMQKVNEITLVKERWGKLETLNNLWLNGKVDILNKNINDFIDEYNLNSYMALLNNQLKKQNIDLKYFSHMTIYMKLHHLNRLFFIKILSDKQEKKISNEILGEIVNFLKNDSFKNFQDLLNFLKEKNFLILWEEKIQTIKIKFNSILDELIPIFAFEFKPDLEVKEMMIVTASFDNLRRFYIEAYETLLIISKMLVLLNNHKYRNNFKIMAKKPKVTFENLLSTDKKWDVSEKWLDNDEYFTQFIKGYFDNQLRNALEHMTFKYDSIKQEIKYWKKDETESITISLIEFSKKCLKIVECLDYLDEIIYQLRKLEIMNLTLNQSNSMEQCQNSNDGMNCIYPVFDKEQFDKILSEQKGIFICNEHLALYESYFCDHCEDCSCPNCDEKYYGGIPCEKCNGYAW